MDGYQHIEILAFLLKNPELNIQDFKNKSILMKFCKQKNTDLIKLLLEHPINYL